MCQNNKEAAHHHHAGCNHQHDHHQVGDLHVHPVVGNLRLAFFINLFFAIVEFIGGALTNSVAILSDAVHDLGDAVVIGVALRMEKLSHKGRTPKFSYGYRRFSILAAFVTSLVLITGSVIIIFEAVPRLLHPEPVKASGMFFLAVAGIFFNGFAVFRLRKAGESLNQKAVMLHLMEDVLGWIGILIGSAVIYYTHWYWIDPILSLAIAAFVLFNAIKNVIAVFTIFLQSVPVSLNVQEINKQLKKLDSVIDVHDIHVWTMDGTFNILTAHVVVDAHTQPQDINKVMADMKPVFSSMNIQHPTIQIEYADQACNFENC